jgi:hypothetical protein
VQLKEYSNLLQLNKKDVKFAGNSVIDDVGKVFYYDRRIFRTIFSKNNTKFYQDIINSEWIDEVYDAGLVRTWVCDDVVMENADMVLEHERFSFDIHPGEWTSFMYWLAAKVLVNIGYKLSLKGLTLKDSHPWNFMFQFGKPKLIDFTSIIKKSNVSLAWHREFIRYFGISIWLASKKMLYPLAREYRKEHERGFGIRLFDFKAVRRLSLHSLEKQRSYISHPSEYFRKLDKWLDKHKPKSPSAEYWFVYQQSHDFENPLNPKTQKQKFVYDILKDKHPKSVLDCGANKGYYSEMSAHLGASVVAFDCEELCVDYCRNIAEKLSLDITPVVMNFIFPTSNYGIALRGSDSFERFHSEIVLALGLIHHLCINQHLSVQIFCDILMKYAVKGIILEFVHADDRHVKAWNKEMPENYSLDFVINYIKQKFPNSKKIRINESGISRDMVYFY